MNFLRSFLPSDLSSLSLSSSSSFPYQIDSTYKYPHISPYFTFHSCFCLNSKTIFPERFSLFSFSKSLNSLSLQVGKQFLTKIKSVKFPKILKFIDSQEGINDILVVVEECVPLNTFLWGDEKHSEFAVQKTNNSEETKEENPNKPFISNIMTECSDKEQRVSLITSGLYSILCAIHFLNVTCKIVHSTLHNNSIFVTKSGDFRLFGLEFSYKFGELSHDLEKDIQMSHRIEYLPRHYRTPEYLKYPNDPEFFIRADSNVGPDCPPISYLDIWGFSTLVFELFNFCFFHSKFSNSNQLTQNISQIIPTPMLGEYKKMLSVNPMVRSTTGRVMENTLFTDNALIKILIFLDELAIKSNEEKNTFFSQLPIQIQTPFPFPPLVLKYRILPLLVVSIQFHLPSGVNSSFQSALSSLFSLAKLLSKEEFTISIVPIIAKLLLSPERGTRIFLLQHLSSYSPSLSSPFVNEILWSQLSMGFNDSSPQLRELTVKSLPNIIDKLSEANVTSALQFCNKMQVDHEPAIRTNTSYCMAKLANSLPESLREKTLLSAFCRALRDPFPPARVAAIISAFATMEFYSPMEICKKLLPSISPLISDEIKDVRDAALKCSMEMMKKLQIFVEEINEGGIKPSEYKGKGQDKGQGQGQNGSSSSSPSSLVFDSASSMMSGFGSYLSSKIVGTESKISNAESQAQSASAEDSYTNASASSSAFSSTPKSSKSLPSPSPSSSSSSSSWKHPEKNKIPLSNNNISSSSTSSSSAWDSYDDFAVGEDSSDISYSSALTKGTIKNSKNPEKEKEKENEKDKKDKDKDKDTPTAFRTNRHNPNPIPNDSTDDFFNTFLSTKKPLGNSSSSSSSSSSPSPSLSNSFSSSSHSSEMKKSFHSNPNDNGVDIMWTQTEASTSAPFSTSLAMPLASKKKEKEKDTVSVSLSGKGKVGNVLSPMALPSHTHSHVQDKEKDKDKGKGKSEEDDWGSFI